jgi:hypothetical protein
VGVEPSDDHERRAVPGAAGDVVEGVVSRASVGAMSYWSSIRSRRVMGHRVARR